MFRFAKALAFDLRKCVQIFRIKTHKAFVSANIKHVGPLVFPGFWLLCAQPVKPVEELHPSQCLSNRRLIQNAAALTVDAASSLLNQTVLALIEVEKEYVKELDSLTGLMEYSLTVLGNEYLQNQVWDKMLEVRGKINDKKKEKMELEMILDYAEKLMATAAETAFLSGSEYTSITASERLLSAKTQLDRIRKETKDFETRLNEVEVKSIHKISQHAEDTKAKEKSESEMPTV